MGLFADQELAERIPPEYRGKTWDQRTTDGVIQSPFPPVAIGNPAEPFYPFTEFQMRSPRHTPDSHPYEFCQSCQGGLTYPDVKHRVRTCRRCREAQKAKTAAQGGVFHV